MNNSGEVVGVWAPVGVVNSTGFIWDSERGYRDLGAFGGSTGWVQDINEKGGMITVAVFDGGKGHTLLGSEAGGFSDIGSFEAGASATVGRRLNNHGQIVGTATLPDRRAAFLWESGRFVDLGPHEEDVLMQAVNLNDCGHVIGSTLDAAGVRQAWLWRDGVARRLDELGAPENFFVTSLNDTGQVVGSVLGTDGEFRAAWWNGGANCRKGGPSSSTLET